MYVPKPRKLPSGQFNIRLRLDGESISITAPTAAEATARAQKAKADYLAGQRQKRRPEASLSLSEAIELYIKDHPTLSPATVRKYENIKTNHWKDIISARMDAITPSQWTRAVNAMLARYTTKTVRVSLGMISTVLNACGVSAPDITIRSDSAERARTIDECKFLEPSEIKTFVPAAATSKYAVPLLLALSSLRIAEIDGLMWDHVIKQSDGSYVIQIRQVRIMDSSGHYVIKRGAKTEGSVRDVPVYIPEPVDAIEMERKDEGKIMTCNQATLRRELERVCKAANIPNPGIHGLRHSFASLCASPQVSIPAFVSQEIGGWTNDKVMKEIYTHVAREDRNEAIKKLYKFYSGEDTSE